MDNKTQSASAKAKSLWKLAMEHRAIFRDAIPLINRRLRTANGNIFVDFATTGYLGLEFDDRVRAAFHKAVDDHGVYQYCSPIYMRPPVQQELEEKLADITGYPACSIFTNVTSLHSGVMPLLTRQYGPMLVDEYAHQSIHDAMKVVRRTEMSKFFHNDAANLAQVAAKFEPQGRRVPLVLTDGVFSMSGARADIPGLAEVCRETKGTLYVDDSHGFGIIGDRGQGVSGDCLDQDIPSLYIGSLGKSMPSPGGFLAGPTRLIETIRTQANTFLFSGNMPFPYLRSALTALTISDSAEGCERRAKLHGNSARLSDGLNDAGLETMHHGPTAGIVACEMNDGDLFEALCLALHLNGVAFNPVMFPAIPMGVYRLRFCLSASHTHEDIDTILDSVNTVMAMKNQD